RNAITKWLEDGNSVDLFFTLHNTETAEYLEGPPGSLAEDVFRTLQKTTFNPSRAFSALVANQERGRSNVVQALTTELKIPAFLMEQRVAYNTKLMHLPEIADRTNFGRELVEAIGEVVLRNVPAAGNSPARWTQLSLR